MDKQTVDSRPCFLCEKNRPECQIVMPTGNSLSLLVNPFPILPMHFTLPCDRHIPQAIYENYGYIFDLLERFTDLLVFYNGPKCGASAPVHMHIQAGMGQRLPLQEEWPLLKGELQTIAETRQGDTLLAMEHYIFKAFVIISRSRKGDVELFRRL